MSILVCIYSDVYEIAKYLGEIDLAIQVISSSQITSQILT